jgi:hypothetical protein
VLAVTAVQVVAFSVVTRSRFVTMSRIRLSGAGGVGFATASVNAVALFFFISVIM